MNIANRKSQLLYVGNEPLLSKASAELLKNAGYKVRTTSPLHAITAVRDGSFGAVILCATLSSEEADEIVTSVTQEHPDVPIVSIHLGLLGDGPNPGSSVVVDALNGPEALIQAVDTVARAQTRPMSKAI
jgi:DNA-binding NtrC family response regulator